MAQHDYDIANKSGANFRSDLNNALEKLKKANESSVVEDIKSEMENLNSPSAEFRPYSEVGKQFGEHAHGWHALVSELSMLAMGAESQKQMEG